MSRAQVDGAELEVLRTAPWASLCVGLLLFELHPRLIERRHRWRGVNGYTPGGLSGALADVRRLEQAGFWLYSSEMVCGRCRAVELAFINASWAHELLSNA